MRYIFFFISLIIYVCASIFKDCKSSSDCSLNGDCFDSVCKCDYGWSGSSCQYLNLDHLDKTEGYNNISEASWGGNSIFSNNQWHLFVAQIKNGCPLSDWGTNSEIVRAVSDFPGGPYQYVETIIPAMAHNPTVRKTEKGEFLLYFIGNPNSEPKNCSSYSYTAKENFFKIHDLPKKIDGTYFESTGIYIAHSYNINGPWEIYPLVFTNPHEYPKLNCSFSNPSPSLVPNSTKIYFAFESGDCKNVTETLGIAIAENWNEPYTILTPKPILEKPWFCLSLMQYEDPFLYINKRGFHLIIHSMCPSGFWNSAHAYSEDGINWRKSDNMPYNYFVRYKQGGFYLFFRMERPQIIFDTAGNPLYLSNGVEEWISGKSYTIFSKIIR